MTESKPPRSLSSGGQADEPMTAEQSVRLKALSIEAYEPEAFSETLTRAEAEQRIATLSAKLPLLDGPPHTL
ncbi:MAG TPA: DUF3072 domain-containing protein [Pseudolabrys sp.]|nr:DUF3072 domain-containing protein [Pseudolabrys sp.]